MTYRLSTNIRSVGARLLSVLFPPSADETLVARLSVSALAGRMDPAEANGVMSLFSYREPDIRALLWQTKYRHDARAVALLGGVLAAHLADAVPADFALAPIPLSGRRWRERGYNQVEWVAREAVRALGRGAVADVLYRTRHTTPQTKLSRAERLTNLAGAFAVRDTDSLAGKDVIVLDDVVTTGATFREARRALAGAGVRTVRCLALAH